jgi:hypothetical protein
LSGEEEEEEEEEDWWLLDQVATSSHLVKRIYIHINSKMMKAEFYIRPSRG